jgi:hypothetical protein
MEDKRKAAQRRLKFELQQRRSLAEAQLQAQGVPEAVKDKELQKLARQVGRTGSDFNYGLGYGMRQAGYTVFPMPVTRGVQHENEGSWKSERDVSSSHSQNVTLPTKRLAAPLNPSQEAEEVQRLEERHAQEKEEAVSREKARQAQQIAEAVPSMVEVARLKDQLEKVIQDHEHPNHQSSDPYHHDGI